MMSEYTDLFFSKSEIYLSRDLTEFLLFILVEEFLSFFIEVEELEDLVCLETFCFNLLFLPKLEIVKLSSFSLIISESNSFIFL